MSFSLPSNPDHGVRDRYLGIDPGLNRTGYAIIERRPDGPRLIEGGILKSSRQSPLHSRVHEIARGLREVLEELQPEVAAIEQLFSHVQHPQTALLMAHARGAILLTLSDAAIPIVNYTPTQIKRMLTGSGKAPKEQIQHAVKLELRLDTVPEPNDVADAAAIALCLYHSVRFAA
ncbi:MAG: crossover junction endodeoxyribonuclease RuvC [Planctomycetaceae bacterium]|nr:crossover junction endodeoxyribonuclease RuvC [Planctomycetaceae bacterium]